MSEPQSIAAQLAHAAAFLRGRVAGAPPAVGLVLGSGLGGFVDALQGAQSIPYGEIPGMPRSSVPGHSGNMVLGDHGGVRVAVLDGRAHMYEGHAPDRVVFGVRLSLALGAHSVILTNAAGGIRSDLVPGDLMLIEDQLNLTGRSCLEGPNDAALGPRFVAMNGAYDPGLRALALAAAGRLGIALKPGVYAGVLGPAYETPAEIRMLRALGADAVGMSTVQEAIALRHAGARCLGLSCITNMAAGLSPTPPNHAEVQEIAKGAYARVNALLSALLPAIASGGRA